MHTFETLINRYRLIGQVKLLEAMHVGSGEADEIHDSLFAATAAGQRFIPGSSFRGALRSTVERIIMGLKPGACCILDNSNKGKHSSCPSVNKKQQERLRRMIERGKPETEIMNTLAKTLCPVCQVFGSTWLASRVRITDLPIKGESPEGRTRFGIGLDRDTETAASGALYTYEVVEKGGSFHLELWAENMTGDDLGVLALGVLALVNGDLWVGAKGAAGLGRCQVQENTLQLEYFEGPEQLWRYLECGKWPQEKPGIQVKQFFAEQARQFVLSLTVKPEESGHAEATGK